MKRRSCERRPVMPTRWPTFTTLFRSWTVNVNSKAGQVKFVFVCLQVGRLVPRIRQKDQPFSSGEKLRSSLTSVAHVGGPCLLCMRRGHLVEREKVKDDPEKYGMYLKRVCRERERERERKVSNASRTVSHPRNKGARERLLHNERTSRYHLEVRCEV